MLGGLERVSYTISYFTNCDLQVSSWFESKAELLLFLQTAESNAALMEENIVR